MTRRNRRREPAPKGEFSCTTQEVARMLGQIDQHYRWLHASGYAKPHRKAGEQVGDPFQLADGVPDRIRELMCAASARLDDCRDAAYQARHHLVAIAELVDKTATPEGIDADMPTASTTEVKRAKQAQERREERSQQARINGDPYPDSEVTG